MLKVVLGASLALCSVSVVAQDTVIMSEPAAAPVSDIVTSNAILRAGTQVHLRMLEEITTKKKAAKVGQRFQMEVASPVEMNGVVVIPAGTPAWGEITSVRNKGMWGKSGKLEARLLYLRVNGRQIRLSGTFDDKGVTGTAAVVGAIALVPIAGFFTTGTSAVLPQGGEVNGFIDEDIELAIKSEKPAPLAVTAVATTSMAKDDPSDFSFGTKEVGETAGPSVSGLDPDSAVKCDTCR